VLPFDGQALESGRGFTDDRPFRGAAKRQRPDDSVKYCCGCRVAAAWMK